MRIRWTIAALAGLLVGLGQVVPASAQDREIWPAPSNPPVASKAWQFRPDLTCEVRAWRNETKTFPLSDGGKVTTHFAPSQAWIEFRVKNVGAAMEGSAFARLKVNSGGSYENYNFSVSNLGGGSTLVFPTVEVHIDFSGPPISSTEIWALGSTDAWSKLNERNEENNSCRISFTYTYGP